MATNVTLFLFWGLLLSDFQSKKRSEYLL